MSPTTLVPAPLASTINTGKSPCPTAYLIAHFGPPRPTLTDDCQAVTATFWRDRLVTVDLKLPYWSDGAPKPGKITMHRALAKRLKAALAEVEEKHPELRKLMGHAGAVCARKVRGGSNPSNHALGLAIDITIGGSLDAYGDGKVQAGLKDIYAIFKNHGLYWGLEFGARNPRREDGMHFEVCKEDVLDEIVAGTF